MNVYTLEPHYNIGFGVHTEISEQNIVIEY